MENSDLLTIEEAAKVLGISVGTLRRRVKENVITPLPKPPALKQPARLLFRRSEIEALRKSDTE